MCSNEGEIITRIYVEFFLKIFFLRTTGPISTKQHKAFFGEGNFWVMGFYFHKLSKGDSSVHVSFFIETVSQVSDVTHGSLVVVNYKNHPVSTWRSSCSVSEQVNRIPEITCYNLKGNWNFLSTGKSFSYQWFWL